MEEPKFKPPPIPTTTRPTGNIGTRITHPPRPNFDPPPKPKPNPAPSKKWGDTRSQEIMTPPQKGRPILKSDVLEIKERLKKTVTPPPKTDFDDKPLFKELKAVVMDKDKTKEERNLAASKLQKALKALIEQKKIREKLKNDAIAKVQAEALKIQKVYRGSRGRKIANKEKAISEVVDDIISGSTFDYMSEYRDKIKKLRAFQEQLRIPKGPSKATIQSQDETNVGEKKVSTQIKFSEYTGELNKITAQQISHDTFKDNIKQTVLGPQSAKNLMNYVEKESKYALRYIKGGYIDRYKEAKTKAELIRAIKDSVHIDTSIDVIKKTSNVNTSEGMITRGMASSSKRQTRSQTAKTK